MPFLPFFWRGRGASFSNTQTVGNKGTLVIEGLLGQPQGVLTGHSPWTLADPQEASRLRVWGLGFRV